MKKVRGTVAFLLVFVLSFSVIPQNVLAAKKKVKLSKKSVTVTVGKTVKVKLKNNKKKVKWTVVSGKGRTVIDGMEQNISKGDVLSISAGCRHTLAA